MNLSLIAIILSCTFGACFLSGCSANNSSRSRLDRAKSAMNERHYHEAIEALEQETIDNPNNKSAAITLAQAHLGAAGIELLEFVTLVMADQNPMEGMDLAFDLSCSHEQMTRLTSVDLRCLLLRVVRQFPNPDNPHLKRAREIFDSTYPSPRYTPVDVNFLAAFVELGSALARGGLLFDKDLVAEVRNTARGSAQNLPYDVLIHHLKHMLSEAMRGLQRTRFAYRKLNQYVVQYDGHPLVRVNGVELVFSENLSWNEIFRFGAEALHAAAESVDDHFNEVLRGRLGHLGIGFVRFFRNVDGVEFESESSDRMRTMFRFERLVTRHLLALSESNPTDSEFNIMNATWKNPPAILKNFRDAFMRSWDTEQSEPLRVYFRETKNQWNEANRLMTDWETWLNSLTLAQRTNITAYASEVYSRERFLFNSTNFNNGEEAARWQSQVENLYDREIRKVLNNEITAIPMLTDSAAETGRYLLQRTFSWAHENLYEQVPAEPLGDTTDILGY